MLSAAVDHYLALRRAGGFKLEDDGYYLRSFVRFATTCGDTHVVTKTALDWASQASSEPQCAVRLKTVIRFARFSHTTDKRHEIPPPDVFYARRQRPTPYLFTHEEIQALMVQAEQLGPTGSLRPHVYRTLIGLLAATGLRVSEALNLRFHDLTVDGLLIRETKFHKSRLLPLHPTTRAALASYLLKRRQLALANEHLFISQWCQPLQRRTVYQTFRQLIKAADLPRQCDQPRPRLVDFRHTFAAKALLVSPDGHDHIGRHTLALMTYLGHAHPSSTYWYLQQSPQLMSAIAQTCEDWIEENKL